MTEVYSTSRATSGEGERRVVEVESASRPGLVYRVQLFGKQAYCPCEGRYHRPSRECRHITEARIKTAPYRVERRHHNLFGLEYAVVEQATGRVIGFRPCYGDAFALVADLAEIRRAA